jgi:hypothetical protein
VFSVTLGLAPLGSPGGKIILSIWTVDAVTGYPGESIGALAELEMNSLSAIPWPPPATIPLVTVKGSVTGLTPGEDYFLVIDHDEKASITRDDGWGTEAVGSPINAEPVAVFWSGSWKRIWTESHEFGPKHLHARVVGSPPPPQLKIERAVQISWPESGRAFVVESAPTPEGPWQPVTAPVQIKDGENRVSILSDTDHAYFRLRSE